MKHLILGSSGQIGSALTQWCDANSIPFTEFDVVRDPAEDLRVENNERLNEGLAEADFVMFLAIFIWIIIIVFICGPSPSPYYRRRNDGPGFWTGAGLGYWAGSTRVPSSSFGYPKSGGRHPSVSYAKPGRR